MAGRASFGGLPLRLGAPLAVLACAVGVVELPSASDPAASESRPLTSPQPRLRSSGHRGTVWTLAFSSDGSRLYSAGEDKVVRVWDVAEQRQIDVFRIPVWPGNDGEIFAIDVSPDDAWIAVGGCQGCSGRWAPEDSLLVYVLNAHTGKIAGFAEQSASTHSLAFSPDGQLLATGGSDGILRLWRVESSGRLIEEAVLPGHGSRIADIAWLADQSGLVTASWDGLLARWVPHPAGGWFPEWTAAGHTARIWAVDVTPDGKWLVSGAADGSLRLWDATTGEPLRTLVQLQNTQVLSVAASRKGHFVAYGTGAGAWAKTGIGVVSLTDASVREFRRGDETAHAVAWSPRPDGPIAVSEGHLGSIALHEPGDLARRGRLRGKSRAISWVGSYGRSIAWRYSGEESEFVLDTDSWIVKPKAGTLDYATSGPNRIGEVIPNITGPGTLQIQTHWGARRVLNAATSHIRAVSILDDHWIAVGAEWELLLIDPWASKRRRCYGHESLLNAMSPLADGRPHRDPRPARCRAPRRNDARLGP